MICERCGPVPDYRPVDQRPSGCYAACIAAITGLALEELPHPTPEELTEERWHEYSNRLNGFLKSRGWWRAYFWTQVPRGLAIASGPGPRGVDHAVVVRDGQLIHDPHPSRAGLLSVRSYEMLLPIHPMEDTP